MISLSNNLLRLRFSPLASLLLSPKYLLVVTEYLRRSSCKENINSNLEHSLDAISKMQSHLSNLMTVPVTDYLLYICTVD